jgi:hypothetical protein
MLTPQSLFIEPPRRDRLTAISSAVQRRPIVLVLGMHRSGTSLCCHLLSALGVDMADDIVADATNAKGHWERLEIVEFHDRILGHLSRDYFGPFHDFALPVAWWAEPRVAQIRRDIVGFLEKRMGDGYFGFKDPRTVRLMPMWHQIFNELELAPKVVLCLRNPAQVARSLHTRDGLDPANGEYRWLVHLVDFFRYANSYDFCTVEYEEWFNNPSANLEKLRRFLDLPWQQSEADLALVLSGIIDPGARHDDSDHREANQPLVRSLYKLARRAGQDGEARDQIAYIVSQFVGFQQLQGPFLRAFEDVAKTAAKYPEIEQRAMALQAAVDERDVAVAAADGRAIAVEGRLVEALAEIERQRAQIAERETALADVSRRDDELRAALQAGQAEAAAREAELRHAEQEAQERAAAVEEMQAEVATLRGALAQADRGAQQHALAAGAMQAEIMAVRGALTQVESAPQERSPAAETLEAKVRALLERLAHAEGEVGERAASAAALQAEIAALRERLAHAEGEVGERAASAAALQAEIVALQGTLTAARQVGRAAIAAFRIGSAAPTKPERRRGWRQAVIRFFGVRTSF